MLSLSLSLPVLFVGCDLKMFVLFRVLCRVSKMASPLSCSWFYFVAAGTSGQRLGSILL